MGSEDKMTVDERYTYLRVLHRRYESASRQERGRPQGDGLGAEIPMTRLAWDISGPGHVRVCCAHPLDVVRAGRDSADTV